MPTYADTTNPFSQALETEVTDEAKKRGINTDPSTYTGADITGLSGVRQELTGSTTQQSSGFADYMRQNPAQGPQESQAPQDKTGTNPLFVGVESVTQQPPAPKTVSLSQSTIDAASSSQATSESVKELQSKPISSLSGDEAVQLSNLKKFDTDTKVAEKAQSEADTKLQVAQREADTIAINKKMIGSENFEQYHEVLKKHRDFSNLDTEQKIDIMAQEGLGVGTFSKVSRVLGGGVGSKLSTVGKFIGKTGDELLEAEGNSKVAEIIFRAPVNASYASGSWLESVGRSLAKAGDDGKPVDTSTVEGRLLLDVRKKEVRQLISGSSEELLKSEDFISASEDDKDRLMMRSLQANSQDHIASEWLKDKGSKFLKNYDKLSAAEQKRFVEERGYRNFLLENPEYTDGTYIGKPAEEKERILKENGVGLSTREFYQRKAISGSIQLVEAIGGTVVGSSQTIEDSINDAQRRKSATLERLGRPDEQLKKVVSDAETNPYAVTSVLRKVFKPEEYEKIYADKSWNLASDYDASARGKIHQMLGGALESAPVSMFHMAGVASGVPAAGIASFLSMYTSASVSAYDYARSRGLSHDAAVDYSRGQGILESSTEYASDVLAVGAFKAFGKFAQSGARGVLSNALGADAKTAVTNLGKGLLVSAPAEATTELINYAAQSEMSRGYGIGEGAKLEEAEIVAGSAVFMSMSFGGAIAFTNQRQSRQLVNGLSSTDSEVRGSAISAVGRILEDQFKDPKVAENWRTVANEMSAKGEPIPLNMPLVNTTSQLLEDESDIAPVVSFYTDVNLLSPEQKAQRLESFSNLDDNTLSVIYASGESVLNKHGVTTEDFQQLLASRPQVSSAAEQIRVQFQALPEDGQQAFIRRVYEQSVNVIPNLTTTTTATTETTQETPTATVQPQETLGEAQAAPQEAQVMTATQEQATAPIAEAAQTQAQETTQPTETAPTATTTTPEVTQAETTQAAPRSAMMAQGSETALSRTGARLESLVSNLVSEKSVKSSEKLDDLLSYLEGDKVQVSRNFIESIPTNTRFSEDIHAVLSNLENGNTDAAKEIASGIKKGLGAETSQEYTSEFQVAPVAQEAAAAQENVVEAPVQESTAETAPTSEVVAPEAAVTQEPVSISATSALSQMRTQEASAIAKKEGTDAYSSKFNEAVDFLNAGKTTEAERSFTEAERVSENAAERAIGNARLMRSLRTPSSLSVLSNGLQGAISKMKEGVTDAQLKEFADSLQSKNHLESSLKNALQLASEGKISDAKVVLSDISYASNPLARVASLAEKSLTKRLTRAESSKLAQDLNSLKKFDKATLREAAADAYFNTKQDTTEAREVRSFVREIRKGTISPEGLQKRIDEMKRNTEVAKATETAKANRIIQDVESFVVQKLTKADLPAPSTALEQMIVNAVEASNRRSADKQSRVIDSVREQLKDSGKAEFGELSNEFQEVLNKAREISAARNSATLAALSDVFGEQFENQYTTSIEIYPNEQTFLRENQKEPNMKAVSGKYTFGASTKDQTTQEWKIVLFSDVIAEGLNAGDKKLHRMILGVLTHESVHTLLRNDAKFKKLYSSAVKNYHEILNYPGTDKTQLRFKKIAEKIEKNVTKGYLPEYRDEERIAGFIGEMSTQGQLEGLKTTKVQKLIDHVKDLVRRILGFDTVQNAEVLRNGVVLGYVLENLGKPRIVETNGMAETLHREKVERIGEIAREEGLDSLAMAEFTDDEIVAASTYQDYYDNSARIKEAILELPQKSQEIFSEILSKAQANLSKYGKNDFTLNAFYPLMLQSSYKTVTATDIAGKSFERIKDSGAKRADILRALDSIQRTNTHQIVRENGKYSVVDRSTGAVILSDATKSAAEAHVVLKAVEGLQGSVKIAVEEALRLSNRAIDAQIETLETDIKHGSKKKHLVERNDGTIESASTEEVIGILESYKGSFFPYSVEPAKFTYRATKTGENEIIAPSDNRARFKEFKERYEAQGYTVSLEVPQEFDSKDKVSALRSASQKLERAIRSGASLAKISTLEAEVNSILAHDVSGVFKVKGAIQESDIRSRSIREIQNTRTDIIDQLADLNFVVSSSTAQYKSFSEAYRNFLGRGEAFTDFKNRTGENRYEYEQDVLDRMDEKDSVKKTAADLEGLYMDYLRHHDKFDVAIDKISSFCAVGALGGKFSNGAINLTNIITGLPFGIAVHAELGVVGAGAAVATGTKQFLAAATGNLDSLPSEVQWAYSEIKRQKLDDPVHNTEAYTDLNSARTGMSDKLLKAVMLPIGITEGMNRQVSILSAFDAATRQDPTASKEERFKRAFLISTAANGDYGKSGVPSLLRGNGRFLKPILMFMKYPITQASLMVDAISKGRYGAAAAYATTCTALGGLGATPLGLILLSLIKASGAFDDDDPDKNAIMQLLNEGLISFVGVKTSGSFAVGLPKIEDAYSFGGYFGSYLRAITEEAIPYYQNGDTYRAVESLLPEGLKKPVRTYREYKYGVTTTKGTPVILDKKHIHATLTDVYLSVLNFTSYSLAQKKEIVFKWNQRSRDLSERLSRMKQNYAHDIDRYGSFGKFPEELKAVYRAKRDAYNESARNYNRTRRTPDKKGNLSFSDLNKFSRELRKLRRKS